MKKQAKVDKSVQITGIVVAGIVILAVLAYVSFGNLTGSNTISVTGESSIEVIPDTISLYLSVETEDNDKDDAADENAEIVEDVRLALMRLGFNSEEIQTTSFSVRERYDWERNYNQNFVAIHQLKLEISTDDSDKSGDAIDAAVDAGALISYINYELSQEKQNEYKAEATKQAAEDAKAKAEGIAEGLGKKLGSLVKVSDSNFNYYPHMLYEAEAGMAVAEDAKAATTNIQPSEQTVYGRVSVVYKIK